MGDISDKLRKIYQSIPEVDCFSCGSCCKKFKPAFGIAELIAFSYNLSKVYARDRIKQIAGSSFKQGCSFLNKDNLCSVWNFRPLACRVFGIDVIYEGEGASDYQDNCLGREKLKLKKTLMSLKDFNLLHRAIDELNEGYLPISQPFWLRALSFDSWVSLYLADDSKDRQIKELQGILRKSVNLDFLPKDYQDKVNLPLKLEQLLRAQQLFKDRHYEQALLELSILRNDNPDNYALEESLFSCGVCLQNLGNREEAALVYKSVFIKTAYRDRHLSDKAKKALECLKSAVA